jgi:hypothetical protein
VCFHLRTAVDDNNDENYYDNNDDDFNNIFVFLMWVILWDMCLTKWCWVFS